MGMMINRAPERNSFAINYPPGIARACVCVFRTWNIASPQELLDSSPPPGPDHLSLIIGFRNRLHHYRGVPEHSRRVLHWAKALYPRYP